MANQYRARILILDDEPDWREQVGELLREHGFYVAAFSTAYAAKEALTTPEPFNLAIIDMRLDDTDENDREGLQLAFELRDIHKLGLPIIILSSYDPKTTELKKLTRAPYRFQFVEKSEFSSKNGLLPCIFDELPFSSLPSMDYDNFDIQIRRRGNKVVFDVIDSPAGGGTEEVILTMSH